MDGLVVIEEPTKNSVESISVGDNLSRDLVSIFAMQKILMDLNDPIDMPLRHFFAPHVCLREITMPANSFVIGKMHKTEHLNIITKGDVSVMGADGKAIRYTVTSHPIVFVSYPGVKKVLYNHAETVWMVPHITEETDLDKLEQDVIVPDNLLCDSTGKILLDEKQLKLLVGG